MGQIRNRLFELCLASPRPLPDLPGLVEHRIDPVDQLIRLPERQIRGQPEICSVVFQKLKLAADLPDLPPVKH